MRAVLNNGVVKMRKRKRNVKNSVFLICNKKKRLTQFVTKYLDFTKFSCKKIGFRLPEKGRIA